MTKKIHESNADEEAYSEFVREYNTRRHRWDSNFSSAHPPSTVRNWFEQERISPIIATRNQLLAMDSHTLPQSIQNNQKMRGDDDC